MNRRTVLKTAAVSSLALLLPRLLSAQEVPSELQITISSEIGNNHGHEVSLSMAQVIQLLRQTAGTEIPASLNIQGQSGHPHALELFNVDLLTLLITGVLDKPSTVVAGHAHSVLIKMDLGEAANPEEVGTPIF